MDSAVGLAFDADDLIELRRVEIDYQRRDAAMTDAQRFSCPSFTSIPPPTDQQGRQLKG
jgi:hypothetical protein